MRRRLTLEELAARLKSPAALSPEEEELLHRDPRQGVRALLAGHRARRRQEVLEAERLQRMLDLERPFWERGICRVAGVDEAGRGPLAGPVVAAAVVMPPGVVLEGLKDSKQLTAAQREELYCRIRHIALGVGVGIGPVELIDRVNIYHALMAAMRAALRRLPLQPEFVLVDGYPVRELDLPQQAVVGGDALCHGIAAASVVAKVTRDRIMAALHRRWPGYGFDQHKGYATAGHRAALARLGPCPCHRRSFNLDGQES